MNEPINTISATGKEIEEVICMMEEFLSDKSQDTVMIACLSLAMMIQAPTISREQLQAGVMSVSQNMALYLSGIEDGFLTKEQLN